MTQLQAGDRIELVAMPNDPAPIEVGARGTVRHVSTVQGITPRPYDQVDVEWDNGRTLGLCIPPDSVRVVR